MASSALFDMVFGAIFLGTLADKIGRRWTISICVFLFSVFTAAAGFTSEKSQAACGACHRVTMAQGQQGSRQSVRNDNHD